VGHRIFLFGGGADLEYFDHLHIAEWPTDLQVAADGFQTHRPTERHRVRGGRASEGGEDGHGVLTGSILDGLGGAADRNLRGNRDGKVSVLEVGEWAKARVPQISARLGQTHAQRPRWYFTGDDMFDLRSAEALPQR
jgi:hypothetical protein